MRRDSMIEDRPPLRLCPRCRITMQAGRSRAEGHYATFTCQRCDLVFAYAPRRPEPRDSGDGSR